MSEDHKAGSTALPPAGPTQMTTTTAATSSSSSRYGDYAWQGGSARRPNYIVERTSPAMLCNLRLAAAKPYTPLPNEYIAKVAQPQDYSLRPMPFVSHQSVIDFYRGINGHYGVQVDNPRGIQLVTLGSYAHGGKGLAYRQQLHQQQLQKHHRPGTTSASSATTASPGLAPDVHAVTPSSSSPSARREGESEEVGGASDTANDTNDYRLSQFHRNAQHVDNAVYGRICLFYNTREGCRRGPYCEYLHLDKNGNVVSKPYTSPSEP